MLSPQTALCRTSGRDGIIGSSETTMRRSASLGLGLIAAAALASSPAAAHTFGAYGAGFVAGLSHPLSGLDHLLAMVAVGLWASQLGGRAIWRVPAAFVGALAAGAGLAVMGVGLPAVEPGIMASMLVLGLLVAFAVRPPAAAGMAIVALFALFHGHAHGAEMSEAAQPLLYGLGFALASVALHGVGIGLGIGASRLSTPMVTRLAGAAVATAGLWALLAAG
jgi:urease accessory protein